MDDAAKSGAAKECREKGVDGGVKIQEPVEGVGVDGI